MLQAERTRRDLEEAICYRAVLLGTQSPILYNVWRESWLGRKDDASSGLPSYATFQHDKPRPYPKPIPLKEWGFNSTLARTTTLMSENHRKQSAFRGYCDSSYHLVYVQKLITFEIMQDYTLDFRLDKIENLFFIYIY